MNLIQVINIIGALSFFIFGMKMMSEGIQRAAGTQIRRVLRSITSKPMVGTLVGIFTTSLVQSSSAVTVLIVSFVNAGIISLRQSVGLIMGSNVGTTITTWLIVLLGYNFSISNFSLPIFAVGVPLLFRSKTSKHWGEFIIGLGILIISLSFLKSAVPDVDENSYYFFEVIDKLGRAGFFSRILFVFIGMVLAIITVSSSVAIALILTMCLKGYVPFDLALFLVLGTNVGTCLTAELAAWVGNTEAKRAARIHTFLNLFGVIYMIALTPLLVDGIKMFLAYFDMPSPFYNPKSMNYGVAIYHTLFNVLNVIIFLPFINFLVKVAVRSIPQSSDEKDIVRNRYINSSIKTPELSVLELRNNTSKYAKVLNRMIIFNKELFNTYISKEQTIVYNRISKYNGISDKIYFEINEYLTRSFEEELSSSTNLTLRTLYNINRELNALGNTYTKLAEELERKRSRKIWVSPEQRQYINEYIDDVNKLTVFVEEMLAQESVNSNTISEAYEMYEGLLTKKDAIIGLNQATLMDEENINGAVVFENIIGLLHKVCKHNRKIIFQISQDN